MHRPSLFPTVAATFAAALLCPIAAHAATIRGQVTAAASGSPLPRAIVVLRRPVSAGGVLTETTDGQGRYEFANVAPGRYELAASKIGYVTLVAENENRTQVDFRMIKAGAITGRITDDYGEPLEARISAQRFEFSAGLRRLVPVGRPAASNDLGEFRVYGLPPGQYYLSAATSYAPTYFPGTANAAEAQPITIVEGQDAASIAMAILPVQTARITGTVTDSNGRAMSGANVMILQAGMGSAAGQVNGDGGFTVTDISPGEYTIKISRRLGDGQEVASARVSINGEDVTGLALAAQQPALVRGRVVLDVAGGDQRPTLPLNALRIYALRALPEETVATGISTGAVDEAGTFEVSAPSGATILRPGVLPNGWQFKAVRLNGLDVTDGGLDLPSGQAVDGVEMVVSNRPSEISGTVTDGSNRPLSNYAVVIFPEDRRQWNFQSRFLTRSRPDDAGRFKATNLPPGNYLAIAVGSDKLEPGGELDPAFLERALPRATRLSLVEGETRTLDLKLQTLP